MDEMEKELEIKIKYFNPELTRVEKFDIGDWIDLRAAKTIDLKKGEFCLIPLGVAMELPAGYEAWLTSRSSLCKKFGVFHCDDMGIIDCAYKGDNDQWFLPVLASRDAHIEFNDRICQFRIAKSMPKVKLIEVESLGNPDRGGIGSTGVN